MVAPARPSVEMHRFELRRGQSSQCCPPRQVRASAPRPASRRSRRRRPAAASPAHRCGGSGRPNWRRGHGSGRARRASSGAGAGNSKWNSLRAEARPAGLAERLLRCRMARHLHAAITVSGKPGARRSMKDVMFRLAHLSDVHLGPLPDVAYRDLVSKRMLGYVNWQRNRRRPCTTMSSTRSSPT